MRDLGKGIGIGEKSVIKCGAYLGGRLEFFLLQHVPDNSATAAHAGADLVEYGKLLTLCNLMMIYGCNISCSEKSYIPFFVLAVTCEEKVGISDVESFIFYGNLKSLDQVYEI